MKAGTGLLANIVPVASFVGTRLEIRLDQIISHFLINLSRLYEVGTFFIPSRPSGISLVQLQYFLGQYIVAGTIFSI